jgi:hypothetical protein
LGDGIPIDEGEGGAGVVDPDPGAATRFRRTEDGSPSQPQPGWRQRRLA